MTEIYNDIEFNEINRTKKVRKKKNYLVRFLIFVAVIAVIGLILSSSLFDVKKVEVKGNSYYSDKETINISGVQFGENIFWGLKKGDIEKSLKDDPYFAEVKIKRKIPSTIVIEVKERAQVAAVTYGDRFVVIDNKGIVLRKSKIDPKLTLLTGLTISKLEIGEKIEAEEEAALSSTLKMISAMKKGDIYFKKINVTKVIVKAYIFDTLVVKGTPKQMINSIKSGDLQKVTNNFLKNRIERGTLSLGDNNYMSFSPVF